MNRYFNKSIFSPTGRICRKEFIVRALVFNFFQVLIGSYFFVYGIIPDNVLLAIIFFAAACFVTYLQFVNSLKRLHDLGYSWYILGFFFLLSMVSYKLVKAVLGILSFVLFIILAVVKGNPGKNKFGRGPLDL